MDGPVLARATHVNTILSDKFEIAPRERTSFTFGLLRNSLFFVFNTWMCVVVIGALGQ